MAEPVVLQIKFDASGAAVISQTTRGIDSLTASIGRLSAATGTAGLPRALAAAQAELNGFAGAINNRLGAALTFATRAFQGFYEVASRLVQIGLFKISAEFIGLAFAAERVSKAFLDVNERFAGLQITLKSSFGSLNIAQKLRQELLKIAPSSILSIKDLESTFRSASVIPFTRSQIAQDVTKGSNATIENVVNLVSQLRIFRPDKSAEEAIFAIREALTGQFRSIIRRFDIPSSALTVASGKTLKELETQPDLILKAMEKYFSGIITPQAVREFRRQPSVIFEKLKEQIGQLPLLFVGDQGLYENITVSLGHFLDTISNFVFKGIQPYALRISQTLSGLFDKLTSQGSGVIDKVLSKFGVGAAQRPDLSFVERVAEGATSGIESLSKILPGILDKAVAFFEKLIPILEALGKTALFVVNSFVEHPIVSTAVFALRGAIFGAIGSSLLAAKETIAASIAKGVADSLSRNGTLNAALQAGSVRINSAGRIINAATGAYSPTNFAPNVLSSKLSGAATGLGAGLLSIGGQFLIFATAVSAFVGAVAVFQHFSEKWGAEAQQQNNKLYGFSQGFGLAPEDIAQQLLQSKADLKVILESRGAESALRGPDATFDRMTQTLSVFVENFVKTTDNFSALRDLLKSENLGKTLDIEGKQYTGGGIEVNREVARLVLVLVNLFQQAQLLFPEGVRGIRPGLIPSRPEVLTENREKTVARFQAQADKLNKQYFLTTTLSDTLGKVNDSVETNIRLADQYEGNLLAFRDTLRDLFTPNLKGFEDLKGFFSVVEKLNDSFELIGEVSRDPKLISGADETGAVIDTLIDQLSKAAGKDSFLVKPIGRIIDQLLLQAENYTDTGLQATLQKAVKELRASMQVAGDGILVTFLREIDVALKSIKGAGSEGFGNVLAERFGHSSGIETLFPRQSAKIIEALKGLTVSPYAEGFKATTQARLLGGEKFDQTIAGLKSNANVDTSLEAQKQVKDYFDKIRFENEELGKQIRGEGIFKSFADGFTDLTEEWRVTAANMKTIGKELATNLSTDFSNSFSEFELGTKSASQAFSEFGQNFLKTAINLLNQKAVQAILGYATKLITGYFSTDINVNGLTSSPSAYSTSGVPSTYSIPQARGGYIGSGSGLRDDVPALLMRGEYVIPASVVSKYGVQAFDSLRGYAGGGIVGSNPVASRGNSYNIVINVDDSGSGNAEDAKALARQIKSAVLQVIDDQKRIGGRLRNN